MENLVAQRDQIMNSFYAHDPSLLVRSIGVGNNSYLKVLKEQHATETAIVEDGPATSNTPFLSTECNCDRFR